MAAYTDQVGQRMAMRLRDIAKSKGTGTSVLQMRYAQAGALRRIVQAFGDQFVLKGGSLHFIHFGDDARPTSDLDLHSEMISSTRLAGMVIEALSSDLEDGLRLQVLRTYPLQVCEEDAGARVECIGWLGDVRSSFHVDCAAGTPCEVEWREYPPLVKGMSTFSVPCQPWPSVAADKLAAFVTKGFENTRVRDAYDIQRLMSRLDRDAVARCVASTFSAKGIGIPGREDPVPSLTREWGIERQGIWTKWQKRVGAVGLPADLAGVVEEISPWAHDVLERAHSLVHATVPMMGRAP